MSEPLTPKDFADFQVVVRLARPEELGQVGDVLERAYDTSYGIAEDYRASLHQLGEYWAGTGDIWVALLDGVIAGALVTPVESGDTHFVDNPPAKEIGFRQLGVDPIYRGKGVAKALIEHVELLGKRYGASAIGLYSGPHMTQAHDLYRSLGFVRVPERDGHIPDTDHILWAFVRQINN
jgi:putative glutathione S-transferase